MKERTRNYDEKIYECERSIEKKKNEYETKEKKQINKKERERTNKENWCK